jgi:hypothetical protein
MVVAGMGYRGTRARARCAASNGADESGLVFTHPGTAGEEKPQSRQSQIFVLLHLSLPQKKIRSIVVSSQSSTQAPRLSRKFLDFRTLFGTLSS